MNILYVENHAVFAQQVTRQFLSTHQLTVAANLLAAGKAWKFSGFDVVLVDYDFDDGKGVQFVRELRATNVRVPIIGVSSHEEGNAALLSSGASAICSKMDFDRISSVIEKLMPGVHQVE